LILHSKPPYTKWYSSEKPPNVSDYIDNRLKLQLDWYNSKSTHTKYIYYILQVVIIGVSILIPIVNVVNVAPADVPLVKIASSALAGIIVGAAGINQLTKANETWIIFRSTAETLKKEYNLYMLKAGDYSDASTNEKRDRLFIERSESIMAMEGTKYFALRQKEEQSKKNSAN
jgi:hypothetical protein